MPAFRIVPRSAVYGDDSREEQRRSMPVAMPMQPHAGRPGTAAYNPHLALEQQNRQLKAALQKVLADRQRIVKEANAKLSALGGRVRQLEGFIRTGYSPNPQAPGRGQVDVGVPTHAMRNPNIYTTDGGQGAPPAQVFDPSAGNPHDSAGPPGTGARTVHESVRAAEDAIFYGRGDAAFYEGGEND